MDGNGRWAKQRLRPRVWGHIRGANIVSDIVEASHDLKLEALTFYAFSTENWSRPEGEVATLFKLLKKFLIRERKNILKNNIKFKIIGEIENLPEDTQKEIIRLEDDSKSNTGLKLSFAFGYGGRQEIVHAVNKFIKKHPTQQIKMEDLAENLYRPESGDVDLLIRTGGDLRVSNFLLWQISYAELFFTKTKWPDFTRTEYIKILNEVSKHDRRFGGLNNEGNLLETTRLAAGNINKWQEEKKR